MKNKAIYSTNVLCIEGKHYVSEVHTTHKNLGATLETLAKENIVQ